MKRITGNTTVRDDHHLACELPKKSIPPYPLTYSLGKILAAAAKGAHDFDAQWAGLGVALARELPAADLIQISGQRMAGRVTLVTLEYSRMFGQPPARIIRDALESEQSVKYVAPTGGLA